MGKRIAAINDLSGFGKCSLTATIPVLAAMGVQACPLPTAILSNQTGYDSYYMDDYTSHMESIMDEWEKQGFTFDGIYTGFLSHSDQVEKVLLFQKRFSRDGVWTLVDPVLGDDGKPYKTADAELIRKMRELAAHADVVTPNLTEACILTGMDYEEVRNRKGEALSEQIEAIMDRLIQMGVRVPIITGIRNRDDERGLSYFCNCIKENGVYTEVRTDVSDSFFHGSYSGTGDLFASVICGGMALGRDLKDVIAMAAEFIRDAVAVSWQNGTDRNDGVEFEPFLFQLRGKE